MEALPNRIVEGLAEDRSQYAAERLVINQLSAFGHGVWADPDIDNWAVARRMSMIMETMGNS